jgi:hypothetical protein
MQPLLQWTRNKNYMFWVCVCRVRYPACSAHAPYESSMACLAVQYFSTLSHKWHDLKKKVTECKMCVLISSTTFFLKICHSGKNWVRYNKKIYIVLHVKYPLFLWDFNETWIFFFWHILGKYSNIRLHENPSSGNWVLPCRWTNMMKLKKKLIVAFHNLVKSA